MQQVKGTMKTIQSSGKRKSAIARATAWPGKGLVMINKRLVRSVEPVMLRLKIQEPLMLAGDSAKKVNIEVSVRGGGFMGQAEASRLAIARILVQVDKKLEKTFLDYDRHLLVADVRRREMSKPNRHGQARAKRQKSYR